MEVFRFNWNVGGSGGEGNEKIGFSCNKNMIINICILVYVDDMSAISPSYLATSRQTK